MMPGRSEDIVHAVGIRARLVSLDVFRGATVIAMLLTITPGADYTGYGMLHHVAWNGWTFTDCVAPCFMWIVGVALALSVDKRRQRGDSRAAILRHAGRRTLLLFSIGVVLGILPALIEADATRLLDYTLMGTLQRIAIAYFIGCGLLLLLPGAVAQLTAAAVITASYAALLMLYAAPGSVPGEFSFHGNIVSFLDARWLGPHSARSHPLLSACAAAATVSLGAAAGLWMVQRADHARRLRLLVCTGILLVITSRFSNIWIPPNNKLWSPTYVLVMGGIAYLLFAAAYWTVDIVGLRLGIFPFVVLGENPLTVWVVFDATRTMLSSFGYALTGGSWHSAWTLIYEKLFQPHGSREVTVLAFAIAWILPMFLLAYAMHRKRWILRL